MNNQKLEQLYKKLLLEENEHNLSWEHYLMASFLVMLSKSNNSNNVKILFVNNQGEQLITCHVDENNRLEDIANEIKSSCSQNSEQDGGNYDAVMFLNVSNFYTKRIMDQSKDGDYFFVCKTEDDNLQYYITTQNAVSSFDTILTNRYEKILEELLANDKALKQITSYGEGEEELIKKLEGGKCSDIPSVTFHKLFESQVEEHTDEPAIICGETSISYNELNKKANQIARYINEYISGKENLIGILMERSIDFIASILGIIKSGNGYIPIDSDTLNPGHDSLPKKRLDFMLEDANMPLVITNNRFEKELQNSKIQVLNIDSELTKAYEVENLDLDISNDNIIYGIYTSGSTGYPKLTIVEHKSVINLFGSLEHHIYSGLRKQGSYRVSQNAPFGFDASVQQFIALTRGDCLCILPECVRHSTNGIINYINSARIDILDCTPSQLELLISAGIFEKCAEHLKCVLLGGEEVPEKMWNIIRNLGDIKVFNVYGPTECTVDSTFTLINGNNYSYPVIGRPIDNCKISIVDEDGNRVPIDRKSVV